MTKNGFLYDGYEFTLPDFIPPALDDPRAREHHPVQGRRRAYP